MNLANPTYKNLHSRRPGGDHLEQAIGGYQQALQVRTRQAMPVEWARPDEPGRPPI